MGSQSLQDLELCTQYQFLSFFFLFQLLYVIYRYFLPLYLTFLLSGDLKAYGIQFGLVVKSCEL